MHTIPQSMKAALTTVLLIGMASFAGASELGMHTKGHGHHHGAPPEFFQACQDKAVGDKVTLKTPHGDTIEAVCEPNDQRLIARPLNPPPQPPAKR